MATTAFGTVLDKLRHSVLRQDQAGLTDAELLEYYVTRRDDAAFKALLRRHGPMVLGVCRRVLQNQADAEDAFQATFLVLLRKAGSIRPRRLVGNWLYGVARRTALKARAMRTKRLNKERAAAAWPRPAAAEETGQDLETLLDQELQHLPTIYRKSVYGTHLRDWWDWTDKNDEIKKGEVVWQGVNEIASADNSRLRLYLITWQNPHPKKKVVTIDILSKNTKCGPFCVALTLDTTRKGGSR
jgi:RNA polymerase sigma factor (sigma-70 family)